MVSDGECLEVNFEKDVVFSLCCEPVDSVTKALLLAAADIVETPRPRAKGAPLEGCKSAKNTTMTPQQKQGRFQQAIQ